jgi:hypothetical protein
MPAGRRKATGGLATTRQPAGVTLTASQSALARSSQMAPSSSATRVNTGRCERSNKAMPASSSMASWTACEPGGLPVAR